MTALVTTASARPVIELKTWPEPFRNLGARIKPFELRYNDRDFQVGDILCLREFDPVKGEYSGEEELRRVTLLLSDVQFGLKPGYVIMAIEPVEAAPQQATAADPAALPGLIGWHAAEGARYRQIADNWRRSTGDAAACGDRAGSARFTACAASAVSLATFHEQAGATIQTSLDLLRRIGAAQPQETA